MGGECKEVGAASVAALASFPVCSALATCELLALRPHPGAQDGGDLEAAERYYTRLLDFGAGSKEAAKSSLREIRTLKAAGVAPRGPAGLTPVRPDSPPDSPGSDMMAGMSPY